jgi:branched-subunit amino acid ABC-type transport system permease component
LGLELPIQAIIQGTLNGLAMGWVYVLMAMGLTLIFGIMEILQFAHGEIYMLSGYIVYYLAACRPFLVRAEWPGRSDLASTGFLPDRFRLW